ncbi:fasciculation and elongation protein zeta-2-like [Brevipalpus obovatus]|uniref:fasciculation and elongation protein zeta-2-like n=1 Tax=Brevipalpus obovatus TaxID=246614 RepID=UPI003D9E262B
MSELDAQAPLAIGEEWSEFSDHHSSQCGRKDNWEGRKMASQVSLDGRGAVKVNGGNHVNSQSSSQSELHSQNCVETFCESFNECDGQVDPNFVDAFSKSLEDLVQTFDEKITKCFQDYDESLEKLAPVQVRSQEDIINNSQMWWTLTGNFGNILPIDWSQSFARKIHLPALNLDNLSENEHNGHTNEDELSDISIDEEDLAKDLDLHSLILSSVQQEPIFTAEQVLEEIDELLQAGTSPATTTGSEGFDEPGESDNDKCSINGIKSLMYQEKLETLTTSQLNELYLDLERMIQAHSEILIHELALRDQLEFEKELKNTFISLLLGIQNKRRQHHMDRKKGKGINEPKYLTTVIPYNPSDGPPDVPTIQILIKILKAVNEDSPTVPTLLTDFILKVLCPT